MKQALLPLGSIVIVRGGVRKCMIIARGLASKADGAMRKFDYGACLYPEGLADADIMFFNREDIRLVLFEGFSDADNELMTETICEWMQNKSREAKGAPETTVGVLHISDRKPGEG